MKRRTVLAGTIGLVGLSGCNVTSREESRMANDSIEQCEESFLRDRYDGDPDPAVESIAEEDGWWRYRVEAAWGHSYREGNDTVEVDHYTEAHYYLGDGDLYRTEERVSDPTTGRPMDC